MPNRKTLSQLAYPDSTLPNVNEPDHWSLNQAKQFLELVWQGIDLFKQNFPNIDFSQADKQLERELNQFIQRRIYDVMSGDEPFWCQLEVFEMETISPESNRPPQYDIAFIVRANERLMFPFEAKVLRTDGQVSEYVKDVNDAFIPCIYAPFSYQGAMLGYLFLGTSQKAFQSIGKSLKTTLKQHPEFPNRPHKFSEHTRQVPKGKEELYPIKFRCHHLIFELSEIN